ncbi:MAG: hypothetical protein ACTSQJ_02955 [Promethearchaeota archaeon]
MEKQRIAAILILSITATVLPLVYQYIIQPRIEGADCKIEILSIEYNSDESSEKETAFTAYISLENPHDTQVIVSPLDLDVYYYAENSYNLIGKFKTDTDFTVEPKDTLEGSDVKGILYISKDTGFYEGSNDAFVDLINNGEIDLKLKGQANYGPVSIPYESDKISLKLTVWDPELIIHDVFLLKKSSETQTLETKTDTFVLHTKMRNPSGLPLIIENFQLNLEYYNKTKISGQKVGWQLKGRGLYSEDVLTSHDPDETKKQLNEVFNDNYFDYEFTPLKYNWTDVFFAFNLSDPDNPNYDGNKAWFVKLLMGNSTISGIKLTGPATIFIGERDDLEKGFQVDMQTEEDNNLVLSDILFYQKYTPDYAFTQLPFTGKQPVAMFENFTIGQISVEKMKIDTKKEQMTLDFAAQMQQRNHYRFNYSVNDFYASYFYLWNEPPIPEEKLFAKSNSPIYADIERARRKQPYNETLPTELVTSITTIDLNLTTSFSTKDYNAMFLLLEELGADYQLLNLTNPFWIKKGTKEHDHNPLKTMEYLIDQGVNPFTMLDEIALLAQISTYQPLDGSHFGNNDRNINTIYKQAAQTDMPYVRGNNFILASHRYFCEVDDTLANWDAYYDDGARETDLHRENQYEVIKRTISDSYFPDDEDNNLWNNDIEGFISLAPAGGFSADNSNDRTGAFTTLPHSDLVWRIYQQGVSGNEAWGFDYDYFGDGDRGYYAGINAGTGESVMFAQNFTLDSSLFQPTGTETMGDLIEKATLSISYEYVDPTESGAYLLFSWWDVTANQYLYNRGGPDAFEGRDGMTLVNPGDGEWDHYKIDLTSEVAYRLDQYESTGNPEWLKGEVSFSGVECGPVFFDDVVLNIKYKEHADGDTNTTGSLSVIDFFDYLEKIDPEKGNMFDIFKEISKTGDMDAVDFWTYMGGDMPGSQGPDEGMDFFKYLQFSNVSLKDITDILQNQYRKLDIAEPANFLEMLTKSKYIIPSPEGYGQSGFEYVDKYGYRVDLTKKYPEYYWTIEDPYNASKVIMQTLYRNIYRNADGSISHNLFAEKELWVMLENLGVTLPWIVMYLLTHGWSADDVFDVFEALGLGSEINKDYASDRDWGKLISTVDIKFDVYGINLVNTRRDLGFDMGTVLMDGTQEFFSCLCAAPVGAEEGRAIVDNKGIVTNPIPVYFDGSFDVWFIPVSWSAEVTPREFRLQIYVVPRADDLISPPLTPDPPEFIDDYLIRSGVYGFNDAGTQQLASMWRANFKFAGQTFITMGGDPVSLFQFLDSYWFGQREGVNYTSFTLLNNFNVSALDFIDILTGYDRTTGKFDMNYDGKANDWVAPHYYGHIGGTDLRGSLQGFGTSFRDNRIFYTTGTQYPALGQQNGKIIWSDSIDFADIDVSDPYDPHALGNIVIGTDQIDEGAPPIVNLIDMLAWISEISGKPDPNKLISWLLGEEPPSEYEVIHPQGSKLSTSYYNEGLNNQKVWRMFRKASLNATGFFGWLERDKKINSFEFLYLLNESTQMINAIDLLFFATSPNLIQFFDGALAFMYHTALDSQGSVDPNAVLWDYFELDSFDIERFFQYLNETGFNIFDILIALRVDPASWLNKLNNDLNIEPIEIIKRMKKLDPSGQYITFDPNGKATFNVFANFTFVYQGITLKDLTNNKIATNMTFTVQEHFSNFIDSTKLVGDNFIII